MSPLMPEKQSKESDTQAFHECTAEIIAANRKNDVSLPSKSCQIRPLRDLKGIWSAAACEAV
jgi:hypothetical protein